MAHFAEIDKNNVVIRVLVVPDEEEHRGQKFLAEDLNLGGKWVQCSYNNKIRKQYPGIGFFYDVNNDVFVAPQPFKSWTLDGNFDWQPPVPLPNDDKDYNWDEINQVWVSMEKEEDHLEQV